MECTCTDLTYTLLSTDEKSKSMYLLPRVKTSNFE